MTAVVVTVVGRPITQGSLRTVNRRTFHDNDGDLMPWRALIAWHIRQEMVASGLTEPLEGPLTLAATFTIARPPSVPKSRWAPSVKPDLDKLCRGLGDAIGASGLICQDSQFVTIQASKVYGTPPGVTFTVAPAERGTAVAA
ncbi:MAG TPA: RusA family crossover junction endodeoxyribonuclease [Spirillospora sp.]|nr:RusA family crossover junction endodeoxyribonuclease [Spirillospora sp.]